MRGGKLKVRLYGDEWPLSELDGAFVSDVDRGDEPFFELLGGEEAVMDANPNWVARAPHSMTQTSCFCLNLNRTTE